MNHTGQALQNCVKSVRIRSFSGPYFPAFRLKTESYGVALQILLGKARIDLAINHTLGHKPVGMLFISKLSFKEHLKSLLSKVQKTASLLRKL